MVHRCKRLKEKKNKVDGNVKNVKGGIGGNAREEVDSEPSVKENSGKLLEEIRLDFVARIAVLHKTKMQAG